MTLFLMHLYHSTSHPSSLRSSHAQRGFALVIALSLMAFVLLLLLSITTLVQVETANAEIAKTRLIAQQNALAGALTALGELQQHCGVDQRSTASAGIKDTDSTTRAVEGVVHPQWMGVWRFDEVNETKELETWLVSGNQDKISTNLLDPVVALAQPSVDLPVSAFADKANAAEYVEVPIVYLNADESDGFAYWVSGQQEKADVGIALPADPLPTDIEGAEVLGGQYSLPALGFDGPDLDPRDPALAKVSALSQLPLIDGVDTTQLEATAAALAAGNNFGLLTNARDGGLKIDLTSKLETVAVDDTTPWVDFTPYTNPDGTAIPIDPDNDDPIYEPGEAYTYTTQSPTWGKLKAFYDLKDTMQSAGQLTPQPGTDAQPGISPRIAMFSFTVAVGTTEPDPLNPTHYPIELLLQPKVVLHNPYNVPLAPQKYMINFFGLAPRFDSEADGGKSPTGDIRSGAIPLATTAATLANPDGWPVGKSEEYRKKRDAFLQLPWMHLSPWRKGHGIIDDRVDSRQRADGLGADAWGDTSSYPPGAPRFELDCNVVMQPGEAILFTPPASDDGQRNPFDRMAPVNSELTPDLQNRLALTPGFRDEYYRYPTSPFWALRVGNQLQIKIKSSGGGAGFFDATLSVLEAPVQDQENEEVAPLFYHNAKRRSYMARQAGADFEDRIYQTTGRIQHNYTDDFDKGNVTITYGQVPAGVNTIDWNAEAYDLMIDNPTADQVYNPYKYFNPRAKIMERSDLKTRQAADDPAVDDRDADIAVKEPTENYFYDVKARSGRSGDYFALDTYGLEDSKVRIGGGLRSPIADTMVLYDVPTDGTGLYSLGQLQHFQISDYFDEAGYAIGNSLRSPHLEADQLFHEGLGVISWLDQPNAVEGTVDYSTIDLSYVFNDALWDRYFFSTTAQLTQAELDAGTALPNPRMQALQGAALADLQDPDEAAANLLVQGAFNVNSTSVTAWKALLAGNHQRYEGVDAAAADGVSPLDSPFFRFFSQDLGEANELSTGYTEVETLDGGAGVPSPLDKLAEAIVEQVKLRGPFVSLAEFVNRQLETGPLGESGALQAAIDASEINADIAEAEGVSIQPVLTGFDDFVPSYTLEGSSLEGLPGMLSQADVLTAIGPFLTARSDTFTITSYGEHRNPMSGDTVRALLEMTVQRMPDFVDSTDLPSVHPDDSTPVNQTFGRRFVVVSTRWLDTNQIQ